MLKPGTGCVDAPRCFSLKLSGAVAGKFGAVPLTYDEQLFVRFNSKQEFDFIATIHVNDIKVACPETVYHEFVNVWLTCLKKFNAVLARHRKDCRE